MSRLTVNTSDLESEGLDIEDVILEGGNLETAAEVDLEGGDIEVGIGGAEGVGIASIEQTVTSTEDGGINEVTQTLTDGTTAVFQIRNGSKGSQGIQGVQGERGIQGERGEKGEKGDAGEDWIPTQQELASIASSAAQLVDVPTKTSDLTNDSHFVDDGYVLRKTADMAAEITDLMGQPNGIASLDANGKVPSSQLPSSGGGDVNVIEIVKVNGTALTPDSNKAVDVPVPTKVSDLQNDMGYITDYTETDPVFAASPAHGITAAKISAWDAKSDFSGSYNDLADKPTIPTVPSNVSAFTNDSHYVASTAITTIVSLTQAQYDALATKDANTLYIIPES